MMGETATVVSRRRATASAIPGTASTGPIETMGLDGQMTTMSAPATASRTPGAGTAEDAPTKRTALTATSWRRPTKYSWNPTSTAPGGVPGAGGGAAARPAKLPLTSGGPAGGSIVTLVSTGSSVMGSNRACTPKRRATSAVTSERVAPAAEPARPEQVRGQVPVPQVEPGEQARPGAAPSNSCSEAMTVHDSADRPHPVAELAAPARV